MNENLPFLIPSKKGKNNRKDEQNFEIRAEKSRTGSYNLHIKINWEFDFYYLLDCQLKNKLAIIRE